MTLNYDLEEQVKCSHCHQWEYWGCMTWKNGTTYCRDCYSHMINNGKPYRYTVEEIIDLRR